MGINPATLPVWLQNHWVQTLLAVILLTSGWSVYKLGLRAVGFVVGVAGGLALAPFIVSALAAKEYAFGIYLAAGLLGGLTVMSLFYKAYWLCIFLSAFAVSCFLKHDLLTEIIDHNQWLPETLRNIFRGPVGTLVFGALGGLFALLLHRYVVILLTAFAGAYIIVNAWEVRMLFVPIMVTGVLIQGGFFHRARMALHTSGGGRT